VDLLLQLEDREAALDGNLQNERQLHEITENYFGLAPTERELQHANKLANDRDFQLRFQILQIARCHNIFG
jgi:hypothetical protein